MCQPQTETDSILICNGFIFPNVQISHNYSKVIFVKFKWDLFWPMIQLRPKTGEYFVENSNH